jgi:hypothetical protein
MSPSAKIVHRTQNRLRLRIAEKRRDLPYFVDLYEHLRREPGIDEVTMNPLTGTVLLRFDAQRRNTVIGALADSPHFALGPHPQDALARSGEGGAPERIERFLSHTGPSATNPKTIIFLIMLGLSVRQMFKGQILAPLLTMAIYSVDFAAGLKHEQQTRDAEPSS